MRSFFAVFCVSLTLIILGNLMVGMAGPSVCPCETAVLTAPVLTDDELTAIDNRALDRYGFMLCEGSCGMACACPRLALAWQKLKPGQNPDRGEVSTSPTPPATVGDAVQVRRRPVVQAASGIRNRVRNVGARLFRRR
jgi:hypothetical protein